MLDDKLNKKLVAAWQRAASELNIRVTSPVELRDARGNAFLCEALVKDFGSATGAVVVSDVTERRVRQHLRAAGEDLWVSIFPVKSATSYDLTEMISTLNDWGWFGPADQIPQWYIGQSWS